MPEPAEQLVAIPADVATGFLYIAILFLLYFTAVDPRCLSSSSSEMGNLRPQVDARMERFGLGGLACVGLHPHRSGLAPQRGNVSNRAATRCASNNAPN